MMIAAVNGVSHNSYKALNGAAESRMSFGAAQGDMAAENAKNPSVPILPDNFYTNISKTSTNNAIKRALFMSKGREEKNGKLGLVGNLAYGTGAMIFLGHVAKSAMQSSKEAKLNFIKAFSPANITKNFFLKSSLILMMAGIGINVYNNLDAKRTAKQRGVSNNRGVVTTPELQRLEKETIELEKKKNAELSKIYSAEYDANMAIYQKVLADAPAGRFSFAKPAV